MPIRYINPLPNPIQSGINVEFFDRKALERQRRHDAARATFSQFAQTVADQPFLNQEARDIYLQQQNQAFEDVVTKYAGNLSAGAGDILGAIEQSKFSPYHNLNRRLVEQSKIRQQLASKYGADYIDQSKGLDQPLFSMDEQGQPLRDTQGRVQWVDPTSIVGAGVEAADYRKIIEDMLAQTSAQKFTTQSGLQRSNDPFYLMSVVQSGEILDENDIWKIALDPNVQSTFLANASTAGIDTRINSATGETYKETFMDPQKLAQYIYGNIQDKQKNNISTKKQFLRNVGAVESLRLSNRKKALDYEQYIKKIGEAGYSTDIPIGKEKIKGKSLNDIISSRDSYSSRELELSNNVHNKVTEFNTLLGIPPTAGKLNSYGDIMSYRNPDKSLNDDALLNQLTQKYGLGSNVDFDPNSDIGKQIYGDLNKIKNRYRELEEIERERRKTALNYNNKNILSQDLINTALKETYSNLSDNDKTYLENMIGATSEKDLQLNISEINTLLEENYRTNPEFFKGKEKHLQAAKIFNILRKYNNNVQEEFGKSKDYEEIYFALASENEKAATNRFAAFIEKSVNEHGLETVLGMFLNNEGNNLGSNTIIEGKRFYNRDKLLTKVIKDGKDDGKTYKITPYVSSPFTNSKYRGLRLHLKISVFDKEGSEIKDDEMLIPNTRLADRYQNLSQQVAMDTYTENINGYLSNPNYKEENVSRARIMLGESVAADAMNDAATDLDNEYVENNSVFIPFKLLTNQQTALQLVKDNDGYYGLTAPNGKPVMVGNIEFKAKNLEDVVNAGYEIIGDYVYQSNPNLNIEKQRIPRSIYSSPTSYTNYAFSKRNFNTKPIENGQGN